MEPPRPGDPERVGPYRIEGRLGEGGMGRVFLGASPGGRRVAVKVVRADFAESEHFRARFAREVEAARLVGGFHTAQVVDADPGSAEPWMATAYIPGPSLQAVAPLDAADVRALGVALAEGLAAIHACGLVHRDLKPGNVIMSPDGPRIIDFGVARTADATAPTSTGTVLGTYSYMSPEQVMADRADPASDVFSLGCVLAFAATGRGPFDADTVPGIVHRIVSAPPRLDGVPAELRPVVDACLVKNPQGRPATAEVGRLLAVRPRRVGRRAVLAGAAAGTAVVVGVPAVLLLGRGGGADERPAPVTPLTTPRPVGLAGGPVATFRLAFTPDSSTLVSAGYEQLWKWPVATGEGVEHDLGSDGTPAATTVSGDGRVLATIPDNATVQLWNVATGARTVQAKPTGGTTTRTLALSPDGRRLAVPARTGVELFDTATGRRTHTIPGHSAVGQLEFSPDGARIALGTGSSGGLQVHGVRPGREPWSPSGSRTAAGQIAFTPDGGTIASVGRGDRTVTLRSLATGETIREIEGHLGEIPALAFSPDSRTLATASRDGSLRLWNAHTGEQTAALNGEKADGGALAFSPNGSLVAYGAGTANGATRLWTFT